MNDQDRWGLLEYIAPGFLHGMGNTLFKIQAYTQVIENPSADAEIQAGPGILAACKDAAHVLEVFRVVLDPTAQTEPVEAGRLLEDLLHMMRGRMREDGVQVVVGGDGFDLPQAVRPRDVVLPVLVSMRCLGRALPSGMQGELAITASWQQGLEVDLALHPAAGCLPFEVDLQGPLLDTSASLSGGGEVHARADERGLRIIIPTGVTT